ncbi:E3 SUMO-protein ligase ZBED1-like isoform X1 [Argopecten irradians]|uniref:E3 SUMO-protein ligase ZBED1-like isoform X1 n=1 Tax=Argopecten irradians TaxID=31199 RepID=UPI00371B0AE6
MIQGSRCNISVHKVQDRFFPVFLLSLSIVIVITQMLQSYTTVSFMQASVSSRSLDSKIMAEESVNYVKNTKGKSKIWEHFSLKEVEGKIVKDTVSCNTCNQDVKNPGGTTNMFSHVRLHHPEINLDNLLARAGTKKQSTVCVTGQRTLTAMVAARYPPQSPRALEITGRLARFIVKDLRPYSKVESPKFKDFTKSLDPRYYVPGRKRFSEAIIPRLYNETKQIVLKELSSAEQVAITTDGWTSRATQSHITVTSLHVTGNWEIKNFVLQTRVLEESHTGENLAHVLLDAFKEWGIPSDPIPPIVSDNASNIVKAGEILGCTMHFKCFAHTINLDAQKSLKVKAISHLLAKIRKTVAFFHRSTTANALLKTQADLLSLPGHKLVIDVPTRWNSACGPLSGNAV